MKISRRKFINTTIAGTTGLILGKPIITACGNNLALKDPFSIVPLGKTDIKVTLITAGTGHNGSNRQSNMTRMGFEKYSKILHHAFDRGVRLFDCADTYGTHPFVADAFKSIPRDKYVLASKIWFHPRGLPEDERPDADVVVNRFLKELNTDYLDLVLFHCMMSADWPERFEKQMEILSRLKEKGVIRAHGISAHSLDALRVCIGNPWVDSVHVRINAYGTAMDDNDPSKVAEVIKNLHDEGKGIVGMKLIGNGAFRDDSEKIDNSLSYVLGLGTVDTLNIGFESIEEIDDYARRVENVLVS
jgi:aryl-alcohol dehydrogenase-like predicted oxidoreductase